MHVFRTLSAQEPGLSEQIVLMMSSLVVAYVRSDMCGRGMLATDYDSTPVPQDAAVDAYWQRVREDASYDVAFSDGIEGQELQIWRPPIVRDGITCDLPQPGIAFHKLYLPGCWVVTAAECHEALSVPPTSDDAPDAQYADEWFTWIAFLKRAAQVGGFSVN